MLYGFFLAGCAAHQAAAPRVPLPRAHTLVTTPARFPETVRAPWASPRTTLPGGFVSATERVFDLGAADPRGLPYHRVSVAVGEPWTGGGERVATTGWVLPRSPASSRDFAVLWNGLVYPVAVEAAAVLEADVDAVLGRVADARAKEPEDLFRYRGSAFEADGVALAATPLAAALLLRLGRSDLAERVYHAWKSDDDERDDLEVLASDLLWARYERGVTAHMRGDDALAYESSRGLAESAARAERMLAARASQPRRRESHPLSFVAGADLLEADSRRRLDEAARPPFDTARLATLPREARIGELIERLDEVDARQMGQPGGVYLGEHPVVAGLVAEGDAVVAPLLEVLEHDPRLTRSVHFHRDFNRSRSLLAVSEAAYDVLANVLEFSPFEVRSTGDDLSSRDPATRKKLADAMRAFATRWQGATLEQRWYQQLQDDHAGGATWLKAASSLAQPTDASHVRSSLGGWTRIAALPPGPPPQARGEALRAASPTVASLIARRVSQGTDPDLACHLALELARWEPTSTATQGVLAREMASARAQSECIIALAGARLAAGDASTMRDYVAWLERRPGSEWGSSRALAFLAQRPDDPDAKAAAARIFADDSPWQPFVATKPGEHQSMDVTDLFAIGAMLELPGYRSYIGRALKNQTIMGTMDVEDRSFVLVLKNGGQMNAGRQTEDGDDPKKATGHIAIRVADYVADAVSEGEHGILSRGPAGPKFHMYWPKAARDAALPALRAWVGRGGH